MKRKPLKKIEPSPFKFDRSLRLLKKLVILYFGITNLLDNKNISRYDYGPDYSERADQQSIFGRSLFVGLYVPFF